MRFLLTLVFVIAIAPAAVADPIDCSGGCTIVTCDGSVCTVYHCDSGGCRVIGQYPDIQVEGVNPSLESSRSSEVQPLYGTKGNGLDCGRDACTVKACDLGECTLFGFKDGDAFPLGTLDNNEAVLNDMAEDFIKEGR